MSAQGDFAIIASPADGQVVAVAADEAGFVFVHCRSLLGVFPSAAVPGLTLLAHQARYLGHFLPVTGRASPPPRPGTVRPRECSGAPRPSEVGSPARPPSPCTIVAAVVVILARRGKPSNGPRSFWCAAQYFRMHLTDPAGVGAGETLPAHRRREARVPHGPPGGKHPDQ